MATEQWSFPTLVTQWSSFDITAGIALSNNNLTAAYSSGSDGGVRANFGKNTGKFYIECTLSSNFGTGADNAIGFAQSANGSGLTAIGPGNAGPGAILIYNSGASLYTDGTLNTVSLGTLAGGVVCFSLDLDNRKVWARLNNGPWNGSTLNGNPATGTGSVAFTGLTGEQGLFPCAVFNGAGNVVANFGASAFSFGVPSGFTSGWPGGNGLWNVAFGKELWGVGSALNPNVVMSGVPIDNSLGLDLWCDVSIIDSSSTTYTQGSEILLFIYPLNQDGTTFGDGRFTTLTSNAAPPLIIAPPRNYMSTELTLTTFTGTFPGTFSSKKRILMPPGLFKFVMLSNSATFPSNSNSINCYYRVADRAVS